MNLYPRRIGSKGVGLRAQPRITSRFGPPIHPPWLRCSSLKYLDILHSSRLARRAPRRPKKGTYFWLDLSDAAVTGPSGRGILFFGEAVGCLFFIGSKLVSRFGLPKKTTKLLFEAPPRAQPLQWVVWRGPRGSLPQDRLPESSRVTLRQRGASSFRRTEPCWRNPSLFRF